jgi:hypothetical protein
MFSRVDLTLGRRIEEATENQTAKGRKEQMIREVTRRLEA